MSAISLRGILETNKLVGPNFDDWYRNLRIVLMHEKLIDCKHVIFASRTITPKEIKIIANGLAVQIFNFYVTCAGSP